MAKHSSENSVDSLLAQFQKTYGENIAGYNIKMENVERIPTGIFPFDLATGGGFPEGLVSILYGPESSNKTNMALKAVSNHQRMRPSRKCIFVDVEGHFDGVWATKLGVDTSQLLVVRPDYAEQTVDIVDALLYAEDAGMIIVDSLAAFISLKESEASAEDEIVGLTAKIQSKLFRKCMLASNKLRKNGKHCPAVIIINQTRPNVGGGMYAASEIIPGAALQKFASSLTVRMYGKNAFDNSVTTLPVIKDTKCAIKKFKVPTTAEACEFKFVLYPHNGLSVGECDDFNTVLKYLKDQSLLTKAEKGTGWVFLGESYKTQIELVGKFKESPDFYASAKSLIIKAILNTDD